MPDPDLEIRGGGGGSSPGTSPGSATGLVRISKTRYRWKDLSLLTLLLTNLLT